MPKAKNKFTEVVSKPTKLPEIPEYKVTYSRETGVWAVHINQEVTYILKRQIGKKNMYYVGTAYRRTLRDAIFSVLLGNMLPF